MNWWIWLNKYILMDDELLVLPEQTKNNNNNWILFLFLFLFFFGGCTHIIKFTSCLIPIQQLYFSPPTLFYFIFSRFWANNRTHWVINNPDSFILIYIFVIQLQLQPWKFVFTFILVAKIWNSKLRKSYCFAWKKWKLINYPVYLA